MLLYTGRVAAAPQACSLLLPRHQAMPSEGWLKKEKSKSQAGCIPLNPSVKDDGLWFFVVCLFLSQGFAMLSRLASKSRREISLPLPPLQSDGNKGMCHHSWLGPLLLPGSGSLMRARVSYSVKRGPSLLRKPTHPVKATLGGQSLKYWGLGLRTQDNWTAGSYLRVGLINPNCGP